MLLRFSYTLWAPFYDSFVEKFTRVARQKSLQRIKQQKNTKVLIVGLGTGLDIPHLDQSYHYTGSDLTDAMLSKAKTRAKLCPELNIKLQQADAMKLPYQSNQYDVVVLHLILTIVPNSLAALRESVRVIKPGGQILILDKFLKPGERAIWRRLANLVLNLDKSVKLRKYAQFIDSPSYMKKVLITNKVTAHFCITLAKPITCTFFSHLTNFSRLKHFVTKTNVVFEELLENCKSVSLVSDEPAMANGWFRYIELIKRD